MALRHHFASAPETDNNRSAPDCGYMRDVPGFLQLRNYKACKLIFWPNVIRSKPLKWIAQREKCIWKDIRGLSGILIYVRIANYTLPFTYTSRTQVLCFSKCNSFQNNDIHKGIYKNNFCFPVVWNVTFPSFAI